MKLTTKPMNASHSGLMFWGEEAADKRDLKMAVGRYNEKLDELLIAGDDDLTRKVLSLHDLGVNFNIRKHRSGNYYLSDVFATPTSNTDGMNEAMIAEATEPKLKGGRLKFADFIKRDSAELPVIKKSDNTIQKKPKPSNPDDQVKQLRDTESKKLIEATLGFIKETDGYDTTI